MFTVYSFNNLNNQNVYYGALILNWWFLKLNPWRDCVVIPRDIAMHGSIFNFIYSIHEEDVGSPDPKINVLPLGLYA